MQFAIKTLLVTNDFPPTVGGIQSYLRDFAAELANRLGPDNLVVFASTQDADAAREWDATAPYTVVRWPRRVMLPTPATSREMQRLIREHGIGTVWFGAAAPLALMGAAAKRAGAAYVIATTHGHEVGWGMLPVARQVLTAIGRSADTVTYISEYTRQRLTALGTRPRFVALPSGVDTEFFRPATASQRAAAREFLSVGDAPLVIHNASFDISFINAELDRIKRKAIPKDRLVDTLLLARRKHPGVSNRLDDLCSRYQIDNSRRTKHGALLDAELLAEVYIDLIGARQSQLILASEASDARAGSHSDAPRRQREIPLVARVSEVDREAHRAFVATLGDKPIWNDYLPPPAAAEAPAA